ncbi:hypothetical protein ACH5RR_023073 [Cinchona calisaya]|uniref:Uncharacterized protein n=1 Tax=Cinchona calisaya TaxID=153742 RepID=A0ABD2Z9L4_9GENT
MKNRLGKIKIDVEGEGIADFLSNEIEANHVFDEMQKGDDENMPSNNFHLEEQGSSKLMDKLVFGFDDSNRLGFYSNLITGLSEEVDDLSSNMVKVINPRDLKDDQDVGINNPRDLKDDQDVGSEEIGRSLEVQTKGNQVFDEMLEQEVEIGHSHSNGSLSFGCKGIDGRFEIQMEASQGKVNNYKKSKVGQKCDKAKGVGFALERSYAQEVSLLLSGLVGHPRGKTTMHAVDYDLVKINPYCTSGIANAIPSVSFILWITDKVQHLQSQRRINNDGIGFWEITNCEE